MLPHRSRFLRGSACRLLHETFDFSALVDDEVTVVLLHHALYFSGLVARHDCESIALATDAIVLTKSHQHPTVASTRPAFALECELLIIARPAGGALVGCCDAIVDRSHQTFISRLPFEALFHPRDPTPLLTTGRYPQVQARAGHAQATMTERYVHAAQVAFPGAADEAEERLFGAVAD